MSTWSGLAESCQARLEKDSQYAREYRTARCHGEALGTLQGFKAKIHLNADSRPKYFRAHSVPYAFWEEVEQELQRLHEEGTMEPMQVSDWAAPIVAVLKMTSQFEFVETFVLL